MSRSETTHPVVPVKVEDVTSTWISKILGENISEENFTLETNIHKGSGFLSNMIRIKCKSNTRSYNLIIKLLPMDKELRHLVLFENFDKTEVMFYEKVVPDLLKICPELETFLCKSYYGRIQEPNLAEGLEYASVIVLEDLKPQDYYTITFAGNTTPKQTKEMVEFIAKFHFASMVLQENKGDRLDKIYNFVQGNDDKASTFYEMAKGGMVEIDSILGNNGGGLKAREAYRKLVPHADTIINKVKEEIVKFPCLLHGDLWPNNCLFNLNNDFHTKVIDWQLLGYKDPNIDAGIVILTSLPGDELTKENVDELLKFYYTLLVQQLEAVGSPHLIKRDYEAFSKFFYTWGMAYFLLWCLMASNPFSENFPRLVQIYEFLANDLKLTEFLLSQV